jgi:hypothetical protein
LTHLGDRPYIIWWPRLISKKYHKRNPKTTHLASKILLNYLRESSWYLSDTRTPNRGADAGRDLIVEEIRKGVGGETSIRWLVSCKHHAHSGKAVSPTDELNPLERVRMHKCQGLIGFYSTLPSSGLAQMMEGLPEIEHQFFDREKIERYLFNSSEGQQLVQRFFPNSFAKLQAGPRAADVMIDVEPLTCNYTGQDLLVPKPQGIIVLCRKMDEEYPKRSFVEVYWCLKGEPDRILQHGARKRGLMTEWEDIPDVLIPSIYLRWWASISNELQSGNVSYTPEAFEKLKEFLIKIYPYVARNTTPEEKRRVRSLMTIPSFLGGLG